MPIPSVTMVGPKGPCPGHGLVGCLVDTDADPDDFCRVTVVGQERNPEDPGGQRVFYMYSDEVEALSAGIVEKEPGLIATIEEARVACFRARLCWYLGLISSVLSIVFYLYSFEG